MEGNAFFHVNEVILKCAGLWIPNERAKSNVKFWYFSYNLVVVTFSCLIFTPSELLCFSDTASDLEALVANANTGMTHLLSNVKVCIWFYFRKEILGIIEMLGDYAKIYESCEEFDPQEIITKEKKIKDIATKSFLSACVSVSVTACFASIKSLFMAPQMGMEGNGTNGTTTHLENFKLPYYSRIPFDYKSSSFGFAMAIFYQCLGGFSFAWIIVGFDTLYVAILCYICAHFLVIQGAFKTIYQRCIQRLKIPEEVIIDDSSYLNREMILEMNKTTRHLQVVLKICTRIEEIYTYIILAQMLISLIVFCTCLYLVSSVSITNSSFGSQLMYLIAIECQLGMYCFFGNKVTNSAEDIPVKLYEGNWVLANTSFKRSMMINMSRMLRPIYFTMGKFSPLTLATFVNISKGSYSFFAVLKNTNEAT